MAILSRTNSRRYCRRRTSLSRVLAIVAREEWLRPDARPLAPWPMAKWCDCKALWRGERLSAAAAEAVISACRYDTAAIIELGGGWGHSLFDVWLRGGPADIPYYGFEYTQAGRDCIVMLAALEPRMAMVARRFDFNEPDFTAVKGPLKHAVIFAISTVNQVPRMDAAAYAKLLDIADDVDCLHFEEFGWQIDPGPAKEKQREHAVKNDYNTNFWAVLSGLADEHKIKFVEVVPDYFGMQPLFPMSFVHWQTASALAVTKKGRSGPSQ